VLKRLLENFVRKATDWWFRVAAIERFLLTSAFGLLVAIYGGVPLIALLLRIIVGALPDEFLELQRALGAADSWILGICAIVVLVALVLAIFRFVGDVRSKTKKRVIVVEGRGLRDDEGAPLIDVVGAHHEGQRIPILLDLRNSADGKIIDPERALGEIQVASRSMLQHQKTVDRSELTTVYGGLTSVPYTFLTGALFDDEGAIKVYDWDRTQQTWRKLEGDDDGLAFQEHRQAAPLGATEVVLAVAFSYPIDDADLATTFSAPIEKLSLEGMSSDAHWSEQKQSRLAQQFLEAVKRLGAEGVRRIHLVMAAPNSVVFTFGRRYDKRNLPELVVYQYERGKSPAYPWGVLMPVAGVARPEVLYRQPMGGAGEG
jgi:hypothetical protein